MRRLQVDRCWQRLAHWLLPPVCLLCGQTGQRGLDMCIGCQRDLPLNVPACERCAGPLSSAAADAGTVGQASSPAMSACCASCLLRPPLFARSEVPFRYQFPMDRLIQGLKYQRQLAMGRMLGCLLARQLLALDLERPQLILPVPLGAARYRQRGFNQARELALPVGAALGVPVRSDLLMRQRETAEQAGLDRQERQRNVCDAFALLAPLCVQHVALLDDVVTTTSTVTALTRLLRDNGVQRVDVWAVARAVRR